MPIRSRWLLLPAIPGQGWNPTDTDGDDWKDFADVVRLFNHLELSHSQPVFLQVNGRYSSETDNQPGDPAPVERLEKPSG